MQSWRGPKKRSGNEGERDLFFTVDRGEANEKHDDKTSYFHVKKIFQVKFLLCIWIDSSLWIAVYVRGVVSS